MRQPPSETAPDPHAEGEPPALTQDPHAVRGPAPSNLEAAIGHEVRTRRKALGVTVSDLASVGGVSPGMLSKIENGLISPSLTTLQALARALGAPLTALFRGFEAERAAVQVRAGEGVAIERRGSRAGHQYTLLGHLGQNTSGVTVEPYLITLTAASDVFPTFQHSGVEFLHVLEGAVVYRHGDRRFDMRPGDSLLFDADAPHGPEALVALPCRFLSVICYAASDPPHSS